jgi:glycosyltransferase involved in cell wall biosynthesis
LEDHKKKLIQNSLTLIQHKDDVGLIEWKLKMRIGFISPEYVLPGRLDGGLANYIRKVAHALTARGHQVLVFVLSDRDRTWNDGLVKIIEVKSVQSPHYKFPTKPGKLYSSLEPAFDQMRSAHRLARFVWKHHRMEPIDILQASSYEAPGLALRNNGRIPLISRISSYTPVYRAAYGRQRTIGEYFSDWLEVRQVIDADAAFSPSQFSISLFERLEGFKPDLLRTPVDIIKIEPDKSIYENELSGIRYLLYFGSLSKIKGTDLLADVIPMIMNSHPETHFVFIGRDDGMPGGSKMMDLIINKNRNHTNQIHYFAALPKAQLYPIIERALAVVMPSRADNYPNACLEAQMLGVPVIGTQDSSLEEMIEDGKTGFLIENGNSKELGEAIKRLLELGNGEYQKMKQANLDLFAIITKEDRLNQLILYYMDVIRKFNEKK